MFGSITRDPIFFRSLMITKRLLDVVSYEFKKKNV
jgi:hypothetical protein